MRSNRFASFSVCVSLVCICASSPWAAKSQEQAEDSLAAQQSPESATAASGNSAVGGDTILDAGPHHRVIQRVSQIGADQDGPILETNTFTQLENGLNYLNTNGVWVQAVEAIRIVKGGAVADQGQTKVFFNWNANQTAAVQMTLMSGQKMASHVFGLAYFDPVSGMSVLITSVKDCQGVVLGNQVLYADAFDSASGVVGSIRYTYRKASVTQDILLTSAPPPPETYNLSPDSRLEVWTEWDQTIQPSIGVQVLNAVEVADGTARPQVDDLLDFGEIHMADGQTLWLGEDGSQQVGAPVQKSWIQSEGRTFLIEGVAVKAIADELGRLPKGKTALLRTPSKDRRTAWNLSPQKGHQPASGQMKRASVEEVENVEVLAGFAKRRALSLDYTTLSSGYTNYTLTSTNYWATGPVTFSGTNLTVEGGCVIKLAATNNAGLIVNAANVDWRGSIFRPIVITAADDQSIGEKIGTNTLSGYYGGTALYFDAGTNVTSYNITGLRIAYPTNAIVVKGNANHVFSHLQILNAQNGLVLTNTSVAVRNILFNNVLTNFAGTGSTGVVEHLTSDGANVFNATNTFTSLCVTNSLLVAVGATNQFSAVAVVRVSSPAGVFQTVGAGAHYLLWNQYRRRGASNVVVAKDYPLLSTYAPVVLTSNFTANTTLARRPTRVDPGAPDLGYLYPAADYAWTALNVANCSLVLTGGVVVANYGASGVGLQGTGSFTSYGGPGPGMNHLVRYQAVQEQSLFWGTNKTTFTFWSGSAQMRFTDVSAMADSPNKRQAGLGGSSATWSFADCWLRGIYSPEIYNYAGNSYGPPSLAMTNNLIEGSTLNIDQGYIGTGAPVPLYMRNNLFRNSSLTLTYYSSSWSVWNIYDNLFDKSTFGITVNDPNNYPIPSDKNAFTTSVPSGLAGFALTNTPLAYVKGPFGDFYYPTNGGAGSLTTLIDYDASRMPGSIGLYHYTTTLDQRKEGTNSLDVGFHYVAASNGVAQDFDGDGLPDYFEDANGNGSLTSGETNWQTPDTDYDGRSDFDEICTDHTNPNSITNVVMTELASWRFNNTLVGDQGQVAVDSTGVSCATNSWEGLSVSVREVTGVTKKLSYAEFGPGGRPNINPRLGTVRFWFLPHWIEGSRIVTNATQTSFCLLSLGGIANEFWSLQLDAKGTNLSLVVTNSATNLVVALHSWVVPGQTTNRWHQFAATYSPTNAALYADGVLLTNVSTTVLTNWPLSVSLNRKLYVGGDANGNIANGDYDYLETFNYQLSSTTISNDFTTVATRDTDHDGLTDLEELRLGFNPWLGDMDNDGMPDGWEYQFGLNPNNASNASSNLIQYLNGWNPLSTNNPGRTNLGYFYVGDQSHLFNVDFGGDGSGAYRGPAAAGVDGTDRWTDFVVQAGDIGLSDAGGGQARIGLSARYGPIGNWVAVDGIVSAFTTNGASGCGGLFFSDDNLCAYTSCPSNGVTWTAFCCPVGSWWWSPLAYWGRFACPGSVGIIVPCRSKDCVLVTMPPPINWPTPPTPPGPLPPPRRPTPPIPGPLPPPKPGGDQGTTLTPKFQYYITNGMGALANCVYHSRNRSSNHILTQGGLVPPRPDNQKITWLEAFDTNGTLSATSGVAANLMFQTYLASVADSSLCGYESGMPGFAIDTADATAQIDISPLDDGKYYLYLYCSRGQLAGQLADDSCWPVHVVANGMDLEVPSVGYTNTTFQEGLNYRRVLIAPTNQTISIKFMDRNSVINGLQLVKLDTLGSPTVDGTHSSRYLGAYLSWAPVAMADDYEIFRANGTSGSGTYKLIGSTRTQAYVDGTAVRTNDYRYVVRGRNLVNEGPDSAPVTVAFSGMAGAYGGPYPPMINGIQTLKQAFRGSAMPLTAALVRSVADTADVQGEQVSFALVGLLAGKLELATVSTNGVVSAYTNIAAGYLEQLPSTNRVVLGPNVVARWTPPNGEAASEEVAALELQACNGHGYSLSTGTLKILVKQPTVLYAWGDRSQTPLGDGIATPIGANGHEQSALLGDILYPKAWTKTPVPVLLGNTNASVASLPITNVIKVVRNWTVGAALLGGGNVVSWGGNLAGYLGNGSYTVNSDDGTPLADFAYEQVVAMQVTNLTEVVDIAAGGANLLALRSNGTVWSWGGEDEDWFLGLALPPYYGGLGAGATNTPVQLTGLSDVRGIAASDSGCLALKGDGTVWFWGTWGFNTISQLGGVTQPIVQLSTPVQVSLPEVIVQIVAGGDHFLALSESGKVYAWGANDLGQLGFTTSGDGTDEAANYKKSAKQVLGLGPVTMVAAGLGHSMALLADGSVRQWGALSTHDASEVSLAGLGTVTSIATSGYHALVVDTAGRVWGWGSNVRGELGRSPDWVNPSWDGSGGLFIFEPVLMGDVDSVDSVAAGPTSTTYAVALLGPPCPRELTSLPGDSEITLTWQRYPGAQRYYIQRGGSLDGQFFWLASTGDDNTQVLQSFRDGTAQNLVEYWYRVCAVVDGLQTAYCGAVSGVPVPVPGKVATMTATHLSRQAFVSWSTVENARHYEVWRGTSPSSMQPVYLMQDDGTNTTSFTDTGLTNVTYYYNVRATNLSGAGPFRDANVTVTPTLASGPGPVTGLNVTVGDDGLNLTWNPVANPNGDLYYYVKCMELVTNTATTNYSSLGTFEVLGMYSAASYSGSPSQPISGFRRYGESLKIQDGHLYQFVVSAADATGEGGNSAPSDVVRPCVSGQAPDMVQTFWAAGNQSLYVKWSGSGMNYNVTISPAVSGCTTVGEIVWPDDGGTAEWWITGLTNETIYTVTVDEIWETYATGPDNNSVFTLKPTASALRTMPAIVAKPLNQRIVLSWPGTNYDQTLSDFNEWRWVLRRRDNTAGGSVADACAHWAGLLTTIGDGTAGYTLTDSNLVNGVGYRYELTAISPDYPTQVTNEFTSGWIYPTNTFATNASFGLTATSCNEAVRLSWNVITNANWYEVLWSDTDGGPYSPLGTVSNITHYTHENLVNDSLEYYVIRAVNTNTDTLDSPQVMGQPLASSPPPMPGNFTGVLGDGRVFLSWDTVSAATYYAIYTNAGMFWKRVSLPGFDYTYNPAVTSSVFQVSSGANLQSASNWITVQALSWTAMANAAHYELWRVLPGTTNLIAVTEAPYYVDVREEQPSLIATYWVNGLDLTNGLVLSNQTVGVATTTPTNVVPATPAQTIGQAESANVIVTLVGLSSVSGSPTAVFCPTNFVLRATVAAAFAGTTPPSVDRVDFYANGTLFGSVSQPPYEVEWTDPAGSAAGRTYTVVARMVDTSHRIKDSAPGYVTVKVRPELSAFTTQATDVSLLTRGLPLSFGRSYDSRAVGNSTFGPGWSTTWDQARLRLPDLSSGWVTTWSIFQQGPSSLGEAGFHRIDVSLPGGAVEYFQPVGDASQDDRKDSSAADDPGMWRMPLYFEPVGDGLGGLTEIATSPDYVDLDGTPAEGQSTIVVGVTLRRDGNLYQPSSFLYTAVDGTMYAFNNPTFTVAGSSNQDLYLSAITNQYGDWLQFQSSVVTNADFNLGRKLTNILHSSGRNLSFVDGTGTNSNYWYVNDPVGGGSILRYKVERLSANTNINILTEVGKLTDRGSGAYEVTRFEYAFLTNNGLPTNAVLSRVIRPDGIVQLENVYKTDGSGFLDHQLDPVGITSTMTYTPDPDDNMAVSVARANGTTSLGTTLATYSRNGELVGVQDPNGQTNNLGYDQNGRLAYTRDPNGNFKSMEYDTSGRPTATRDELGNTVTAQYADSGRLDQVQATIDPLGGQTTYSYYPSNGYTSGEGDPAGALAGVTDPSGASTEYHYNQWGQVTNETRLVAMSASTLLTTYAYATNGDLLYLTEPLWTSGSSSNLYQTAYSYDANGNRVTEKRYRSAVQRDANGNNPALVLQTITTTTYLDGQCRARTNIVSVRTGGNGSDDPGTQTTYTLYGPNGRPSATLDPLGRTNTLTYDARGNLIETLYADGTASRSTYDELGRALWSQDRAKPDATNATTATATLNVYDLAGRIVMVKRWASIALKKQPAVAVTNGAAITDFTTQYRAAAGSTNQIWTVILTSTSVTNGAPLTITRTQYDPAGRVLYTMDPLGHVTGSGYDPAGRRTSVTNYTAYTVSPLDTGTISANTTNGVVTFFGYDANGNQTNMVDALGRVTSYLYDASNRRTAVLLPIGTGETVQLERDTVYDNLGRRIQEIDEAGVVTGFGYDSLGRLTSVTNNFLWDGTNATGFVTGYMYDELGNLTNQVDALGRSTTFELDGWGRRARRNLPGGQYETFGYDAAGNQLAQTNFLGLVFTNSYDPSNRLLTRSWGSTQLLAYAYSVNGLRTGLTNSTGVLTYTYDALNRLTSNVTPVGTLYYTYDAGGNLKSLGSSTTSGVTNSFAYDALNRLTTFTDNRMGSNTIYGFDGVGNLQTISYPNAVTSLYAYDVRNRLLNLAWKKSGTNVAAFTYTLGPSGNHLGLAETNNGIARTSAWAYDSLYRLTNEIVTGGAPIGTLTYGYDKVGNRTNRTGTSGLLTYLTNQTFNFDVNDWLDKDTTTNNGSAWFDAAGNTRTNGSNIYLYDWNTQLTNLNAGSVSIFYDGDGNRIKKIVGTTTNLYLVATVNPSGYAQVVEELTYSSGTTNLVKGYSYGLDLISQRLGSGTNHFFSYDGLGSVRLMTGANSSVSNTYTFDTYGTLLTSNVVAANVYLFSGEQWDADLGMYYLRARYMSPGYGRFWTMDTFEGSPTDPQSLHKYLYCAADPVNRIDPSGHDGDLTTMQVVTGLSVGMNAYSAYQNIRAERYAWAAVDILSMGFGIGGMGGPGAFKALAWAGAAGRGATFSQWVAAAKGGMQVSQSMAVLDIVVMAMSGTSSGSASGGGNAGEDQSDLIPNKMPERYQAELRVAKARGVQSIAVTSVEQLQTLLSQNPVLKWVVTPDGVLRVVPKIVDRAEISHAVAAENQAVKAAGEARIRGNFLEINRWSGHYQGQTWTPGQRAFERMGYPVKLLDDRF